MPYLTPFPGNYPTARGPSRSAVSRRLKLAWALVALLAVVAGVAVVVSVWQWIWLGIYFEPSDSARFQADVGESLRNPAAAALALLTAAVLIARPGNLRGTVALVVSSTAVLGAITVTGLALRRAETRLHPSFSVERAAIRAFRPPAQAGDMYIATTILDHPTITVGWTIEGSEAAICAHAIAAFTTWTDPGTAHTPRRPLLPNDRVGLRGPDLARLSCVAPPAAHSPISLSLELTRR